MSQNGVTDMGTAKGIARKLFASYANGQQVEKSAMEKMMIDTYKILVPNRLPRTKITGQHPKMSTSMPMFLTSMGIAESLLKIFKRLRLNIWSSLIIGRI